MRLIDADVLKQHIDKLPALPDGNFAGNHSALKALINMQPTAQPEERTENARKTLACDLISRQAAIDAYGGWYVDECTEGGFIGTVKQLLEGLPPVQPEQRWIPCGEQLPRQGQEVICQCRANMIKVLKLNAYGDWYQDAEHCYMSGFVIAWMPLPEPYQEGGADVR